MDTYGHLLRGFQTEIRAEQSERTIHEGDIESISVRPELSRRTEGGATQRLMAAAN